MKQIPTVLAAFPMFAIPIVQEVLGGYVAFRPVQSLADAKAILQSEPGIALVACGVHFDESRMFDLLRYVRADFPHIPVVCCRLLEAEMPRISIEGIAISSGSLGAATFFDFPGRAKQVGRGIAQQELRGTLLQYAQVRPHFGPDGCAASR